MTIERDEQFRLRTAEALGRIEERGERVLAQLVALNNTVASQGQRITMLEGSWRTTKALTTGLIAVIAATATILVAWLRTGG